MSARDAYRINRMIQELNNNPAARQAHGTNPQATYERYGVTADEQSLLADGSIEAMSKMGVHPNLQMKWLFINQQAESSGPPLAAFLKRLMRRN